MSCHLGQNSGKAVLNHVTLKILRLTKRLTLLADGKLFCVVITLFSKQDVNRSTHSLNVGESVAFWEVVWVSFPEHVTHSAAGENLQASSAHPHPERELCRRTDSADEDKHASV